jgi:hypothetical protein
VRGIGRAFSTIDSIGFVSDVVLQLRLVPVVAATFGSRAGITTEVAHRPTAFGLAEHSRGEAGGGAFALKLFRGPKDPAHPSPSRTLDGLARTLRVPDGTDTHDITGTLSKLQPRSWAKSGLTPPVLKERLLDWLSHDGEQKPRTEVERATLMQFPRLGDPQRDGDRGVPAADKMQPKQRLSGFSSAPAGAARSASLAQYCGESSAALVQVVRILTIR